MKVSVCQTTRHPSKDADAKNLSGAKVRDEGGMGTRGDRRRWERRGERKEKKGRRTYQIFLQDTGRIPYDTLKF